MIDNVENTEAKSVDVVVGNAIVPNADLSVHQGTLPTHSSEVGKGVLIGGVLGSVVPGVGTVIGAVVGGAVGRHAKKKHIKEGTHKF
ncbi:hypothetical protein AKO1_014178 [Acrasis kona]|uniref:Glycine zipper 2TM domain-containing protein n=1 Tax=Acrasis kona TaxID=1008807 RepID=A0AAW2Z299_9EUKA